MSNIKIDTDKLAEGVFKLAAEARERQWKNPLSRVQNDCRIDGPACGPRSVTLVRASEALAIPDGITAMIEYADPPRGTSWTSRSPSTCSGCSQLGWLKLSER